MVPSGSCERDLPGYSPSFTARSSISSYSRFLPIICIFLLITPADSCWPGWGRSERSAGGEPPPSLSSPLTLNATDLPDLNDDYDIADIGMPGVEMPCGEEESGGWCVNGGNCSLHYSSLRQEYHRVCTCTIGFRGARCDEPSDPNVFAAQLLGRQGRPGAPLAVLAFFSALAMLTLGGALYAYRKMMVGEDWVDGTPDSSRTPFSRRWTPQRRGGLRMTASPSEVERPRGAAPSLSPDTTASTNLNPGLTPMFDVPLRSPTTRIVLEFTPVGGIPLQEQPHVA